MAELQRGEAHGWNFEPKPDKDGKHGWTAYGPRGNLSSRADTPEEAANAAQTALWVILRLPRRSIG